MFKSPWVPPSPVIARTPGSKVLQVCVPKGKSLDPIYSNTKPKGNRVCKPCARPCHMRVKSKWSTCSGICRVLVCGCIQELARSTTRDAHLAMKSLLQKSSCASGKKKDRPTADGIPSCSIAKTRRKGHKKWCTSLWTGVAGELCSVSHRVRWESKVGYFKGVTKNRINKNIWIFQSL